MKVKSCLTLFALAAVAASSVYGQTKRWSFTTGGPVDGSPALGPDGMVYITSQDGLLYSFNPQTGHKNWSLDVHNTGAEVSSSPVVGANGNIYVHSMDGNSYQVNPAAWYAPTVNPVVSGENVSTPAVGADGTIYLTGDDDTRVFARRPYGLEPSGWPFDSQDEIESSPVVGPDCTVYVIGGGGSQLLAIDSTGQQKWSFSLGLPDDFIDYLFPLAVGTEGTIYTATGPGAGNLIAINPHDPNNPSQPVERWQFPAATDDPLQAIQCSPALAPDGTAAEPNGTIYFGGTDLNGNNYLYAIHSADGTLKWKSDAVGGVIRSSAAVAADGTIYFGSADGKLYAVEPAQGHIKWTFTGTPNMEIISSPVITADGGVIFGSNDGNVYAVDGSAPLAKTPWPMYRRNPVHSASQSTGNCNGCEPPYLIQQPVSVFVPAGGTVTFHVVAGGATSYQWQKGGVNISGATTDTLTLNGVSLYSQGECEGYTCVVSSSCGSVTSDPAFFTIQNLLNVQFNVIGAATKTGAAALPAPASDYWNVLSLAPPSDADGGSGVPSAQIRCYDEWHTLTSVYVDLAQVSGDSLAGTSNPGFTLDPLMESFVFPPAGGTYTVTLLNLTPGVAYDVYLYGNTGNANSRIGSTFTLSQGTCCLSPSSQSCSSAATWDPNLWSEGNQYVVFRGVAPANRSIQFLVSGAADVINGLQLRPTLRVTGLTATAEFQSIGLNWNAVSGTPGYVVLRSTTPGGPYTAVSGTLSGSTTSYTDTTTAIGTQYYYVVQVTGLCPADAPLSCEVTASPNSCTGTLTYEVINTTGVQSTVWIYYSATPISYYSDGWNIRPDLSGATVYVDEATIPPYATVDFQFDATLGVQYNLYGYGDWYSVQGIYDTFSPTQVLRQFWVVDGNDDPPPGVDSGGPLCGQ